MGALQELLDELYTAFDYDFRNYKTIASSKAQLQNVEALLTILRQTKDLYLTSENKRRLGIIFIRAGAFYNHVNQDFATANTYLEFAKSFITEETNPFTQTYVDSQLAYARLKLNVKDNSQFCLAVYKRTLDMGIVDLQTYTMWVLALDYQQNKTPNDSLRLLRGAHALAITNGLNNDLVARVQYDLAKLLLGAKDFAQAFHLFHELENYYAMRLDASNVDAKRFYVYYISFLVTFEPLKLRSQKSQLMTKLLKLHGDECILSNDLKLEAELLLAINKVKLLDHQFGAFAYRPEVGTSTVPAIMPPRARL